MQSVAPNRAIAVAPLPGDMQVAVGANPGGFPFGMAIPQFYQPAVSFPGNTAGPAGRSGGVGSRSGVCASRHMAAEQRRRARINERLEALRSLVPHSARANTAAFLTEVYDYITALHKQLDRLGGGVIDLNIAASEGKDKQNRQAKILKQSAVYGKRSRESKSDDESEVESEEPGSSGDYSQGEAEHKSSFSTVLAPSLFDSSMKKMDDRRMGESGSPSSQNGLINLHGLDGSNRSAFSPASTTVTDVSLSVGLGLPDGNSQASKRCSPEPCSTQMSLGIGPAHHQPTKIEPRSIQPAPLSLMPAMNPTAVVAAAAAVADAAAAAQSWGMAAAVAQAQAQVAAHVHAQAQAQAQAMMQAHAQVHAQAQVQQARSIPVTPKKRRRGTVADTCAMSHRSVQGVLRPIALKPQR